MRITNTQRLMLFTLGRWFEAAERHLSGKPLEIAVSKSTYIDFLLRINLAGKQRRALYKNLQVLERRKWIRYEHRELLLTPQGLKVYQTQNDSLSPYLNIISSLTEHQVAKNTKRLQTILR